MTPFEIARPRSLREAVALLDPDDPSVRAIAGGTALMLMMKSGLFQPTRLVSLDSVEPEYSGCRIGTDGTLHIGALSSLSSLERSEILVRSAPVIVKTLRTLSNIRVRNVATVGGHLAHADPHMDLPPVLVALGASVSVLGPSGQRIIPVEGLYAGYYETMLGGNELITGVNIPSLHGVNAAYFKCTARTADDWPALGVATAVHSNDDACEARIVISAATDTPIRLKLAETALREGVSESTLRRASEAAGEEAEVVSDQHGSAAYKKQLVRVYVERALRAALGLTTQEGPRVE